MRHGWWALLTVAGGVLLSGGGIVLFAFGAFPDPPEGNETLTDIGFYALLVGVVVLLAGAGYLVVVGAIAASRRLKRPGRPR
jgi:hypothetical protein